MNRVLSIRPWKIGTEPSMRALGHVAAVHACLPSELGGRQVDRHIPTPLPRFIGTYSRYRVLGRKQAKSGWEFRELVVDAEPLGDQLTEAADAEALGRVVARPR